jgi:hypothetical protein
LTDEFFEWACFAAQQAAEKAVKALIQSVGGEPWGHSVAGLIDLLPEHVKPSQLRDLALELDQAYIPSRSPNAHPAGFPGKAFTRDERKADRLRPPNNHLLPTENLGRPSKTARKPLTNCIRTQQPKTCSVAGESLSSRVTQS